MKWNRAVATLLLGWQGSAQLFNKLPHFDQIDPGKIADSITKAAPSKELAHVMGEVKDATKIPDSVKGLASGKAVDDVAGMLKGASEKNLSQVVQAATDGFHDAAQKLNRTEASVLRPAVTEATKAAEAQVQGLKGALPGGVADKGREAVKTVQAVAGDKGKVEHVLSMAGSTIVKAVDERRKHRDSEGATERIREVLREIETPGWWSAHWPWGVTLILSLLSALIAGAVYVHRTFFAKGPRTPNLLVDSEINMWVRPGGGGGRRVETNEEPLFRQF